MNNKIQEETLSNKDTFVAVYQAMINKAKNPMLKTFLMGLASGIFIGITYIAAIYATRGIEKNGIYSILFGISFLLAINMIVFMGGEMFTSNSMMFWPVMKKQVKVRRYLLNLLVVLLGNFVGGFLLAAFTYLAGFTDNAAFWANAKGIVESKLTLPWWKMFFSGILCNFLVAGSVYISFSTRSSTAKFLLISLLISVFALTGFSHVVANSYVWGLMPWVDHGSDFLKFGYQVQVPTLIGNFIGGGILLPGMYLVMFRKELPKTII